MPIPHPTFAEWLVDAAPGDTYVYHRGHLAEDRYTEASPGFLMDAEAVAAMDIDQAAAVVWAAAEAGLVLLTQARTLAGPFLYIATRSAEMAGVSEEMAG